MLKKGGRCFGLSFKIHEHVEDENYGDNYLVHISLLNAHYTNVSV